MTDTTGQWTAAGQFLDGLAQRDFAALEQCLHPEVRFRALVPRGPFEVTGADNVLGYFRRWFGGDDEFEVVDASIGELGSRVYLRWRVAMRSAGAPDGRIVEQHAFASVGHHIEALDLLCSGFHTAR
jgi:hypothetical protein